MALAALIFLMLMSNNMCASFTLHIDLAGWMNFYPANYTKHWIEGCLLHMDFLLLCGLSIDYILQLLGNGSRDGNADMQRVFTKLVNAHTCKIHHLLVCIDLYVKGYVSIKEMHLALCVRMSN